MAKRVSPPPPSIFTAEDRNNTEAHLARMNKWNEDCNAAKECGVDVEAIRAIRDQIVAQLQAVKRHFMPDRS